MKYRSKPSIVDAQRFDITDDRNYPPNLHKRYLDGEPTKMRGSRVEFYVITIHGQEALVVDGDYVIQEPMEGRAYPCKPDIFEKKYEVVET